jgi:hypothetical protein
MFGNRTSASEIIDLHLLAPGCRWLGEYVRQRPWDGLEILTAVRKQLQQHLQQATGKQRCSTDIVVLQPMQHNGQLSDHALGVALLAAGNATPAIEMQADEHAAGYVMQRPEPSSQLAKRRRLAPEAAPAARAAASTWLSLNGSTHDAAAAIARNANSAAVLAAAELPQPECCPATRSNHRQLNAHCTVPPGNVERSLQYMPRRPLQVRSVWSVGRESLPFSQHLNCSCTFASVHQTYLATNSCYA